MTAEEQKAFDRGKHAAFRDARPHNVGRIARCEFRQPHLVKAWKAGYVEQVTASTKPLTPEQEANRQGLSDAITAWLAKSATPVAGTGLSLIHI